MPILESPLFIRVLTKRYIEINKQNQLQVRFLPLLEYQPEGTGVTVSTNSTNQKVCQLEKILYLSALSGIEVAEFASATSTKCGF